MTPRDVLVRPAGWAGSDLPVLVIALEVDERLLDDEPGRVRLRARLRQLTDQAIDEYLGPR